MLAQRYIFWFWFPLALTWLMMAIEGPLLTALIARLDDPVTNLATYGIAFSAALVIEAPIIMLLSATTALVKDRHTLNLMKRFTHLLCLAVTIAMGLLVTPACFHVFAKQLLGLNDEITSLLHTSLLLLLPWPGAIGLRRFYQGLLIRGARPRCVTYGTVCRVLSMGCAGFVLFTYTTIHGAHVGAAALSCGVIVEYLATRVMARRELKIFHAIESQAAEDHGLMKVARFYYPLALTSMLSLGIQPMTTFFVARSLMPIESLAVFPVVNGIVFIFRALGLAFQEVAITIMNDNQDAYKNLKSFAFKLAMVNTATLAIWAVSPFAHFWFTNISGLSDELAAFASTPLMILIFMPAFSVLLSWQRTILIVNRATGAISIATLIEVLLIIAILTIFINIGVLPGAVSASVALTLGRLSACGYLYSIVRQQRHREVHTSAIQSGTQG